MYRWVEMIVTFETGNKKLQVSPHEPRFVQHRNDCRSGRLRLPSTRKWMSERRQVWSRRPLHMRELLGSQLHVFIVRLCRRWAKIIILSIHRSCHPVVKSSCNQLFQLPTVPIHLVIITPIHPANYNLCLPRTHWSSYPMIIHLFLQDIHQSPTTVTVQGTSTAVQSWGACRRHAWLHRAASQRCACVRMAGRGPGVSRTDVRTNKTFPLI